jgi:hypothetical protein
MNMGLSDKLNDSLKMWLTGIVQITQEISKTTFNYRDSFISLAGLIQSTPMKTVIKNMLARIISLF